MVSYARYIGKEPTKRFNKKMDGHFTDMNLGGKMVKKKIFERLHMPLNHKMKFVQNGIMSSTYCFITRNVTDSAVRRLVLMQEKM
jgi:tRNA nucleotidyltransferase (CCA-adding enzyme)